MAVEIVARRSRPRHPQARRRGRRGPPARGSRPRRCSQSGHGRVPSSSPNSSTSSAAWSAVRAARGRPARGDGAARGVAADHDHAGAQLRQTEDRARSTPARRRDEALADLDAAQQRCAADRDDAGRRVPRRPARRLRAAAQPATVSARRCCRPAAAAPAGSNSTAARSPGSPRTAPDGSCAARNAARSWCGPRSPGL